MAGDCTQWADRPLRERMRIVCRLRHSLAEHPMPFVDALTMPFRRSAIESLSAEITPLADACLFLERNAKNLLRPKRLGARGRPLWLWGVSSEIHRVPLGTVLIIGPSNYPLMLPGIQTIQALVAGNRVVLKPAPGTGAVAQLLRDQLVKLGLPPGVLIVLGEAISSIEPWWGKVHKVFVTGSESTGRAVMKMAAEQMIPSTMELSGCDAMLVLAGADLTRVVKCLRFGLAFNGSFSCIAPRRLFVHDAMADPLIELLLRSIADVKPSPATAAMTTRLKSAVEAAARDGARMIFGSLSDGPMTPIIVDHVTTEMTTLQEDFAAPLLSIYRMNDTRQMVKAVANSPYRLGATVFGPDAAATKLAEQLPVGSVVVNDLIVPTADPRLPFGGAGRSGFGVTRGGEGLLEMTRPKVVSVRRTGIRGGALFHLRPDTDHTASILRSQLLATHGRTAKQRLRGILQTIRAANRA